MTKQTKKNPKNSRAATAGTEQGVEAASNPPTELHGQPAEWLNQLVNVHLDRPSRAKLFQTSHKLANTVLQQATKSMLVLQHDADSDKIPPWEAKRGWVDIMTSFQPQPKDVRLIISGDEVPDESIVPLVYRSSLTSLLILTTQPATVETLEELELHTMKKLKSLVLGSGLDDAEDAFEFSRTTATLRLPETLTHLGVGDSTTFITVGKYFGKHITSLELQNFQQPGMFSEGFDFFTKLEELEMDGMIDERIILNIWALPKLKKVTCRGVHIDDEPPPIGGSVLNARAFHWQELHLHQEEPAGSASVMWLPVKKLKKIVYTGTMRFENLCEGDADMGPRMIQELNALSALPILELQPLHGRMYIEGPFTKQAFERLLTKISGSDVHLIVSVTGSEDGQDDPIKVYDTLVHHCPGNVTKISIADLTAPPTTLTLHAAADIDAGANADHDMVMTPAEQHHYESEVFHLIKGIFQLQHVTFLELALGNSSFLDFVHLLRGVRRHVRRQHQHVQLQIVGAKVQGFMDWFAACNEARQLQEQVSHMVPELTQHAKHATHEQRLKRRHADDDDASQASGAMQSDLAPAGVEDVGDVGNATFASALPPPPDLGAEQLAEIKITGLYDTVLEVRMAASFRNLNIRSLWNVGGSSMKD